MSARSEHLLRGGVHLEYATLGWNVVGVVIVGVAAVTARSVALVGFGLDSLIEIFASVVVVWELTGSGAPEREARALRMIGLAFLTLAAYLIAQTAYVVASGSHPRPSGLGIVWTGLTLVAMVVLAGGKRRVGQRLDNRVLVTEAKVTLVDACLAGAVLVGLVVRAALGWWWTDPLAAVVVIVYGTTEGISALR